ncbi:MAG: replication protein [Armatimonas sp.]
MSELPKSGYVPIPTFYIDKVMPSLTDAELRVLLIVMRQTLGWAAEEGGRKRRDWITQSQFREKTGKSRDSITRAVAALVERGLLAVENRAGKPLYDPKSRRDNRDRLYYRLTV